MLGLPTLTLLSAGRQTLCKHSISPQHVRLRLATPQRACMRTAVWLTQVRFKPPLSTREAAFLQELQTERLF